MISRKLTVLIAVTFWVFLVIIPNKASARDFADSIMSIVPSISSSRQSFDCHKVWSGPNHKNDVKRCLINMDRVKSQWRTLLFPVMNVVLLGVLLISFPLVFLITACSHCCCQPGTKKDHRGSRCCNWMWIVYTIIWSCGVTVLVIFGAKILSNSAPKLIDDTLDGPLKYFNETAEHILDFASDWSSGKRESLDAVNLDISPFTDVSEYVLGILSSAKEQMSKYLYWVPTVSYTIGAVGITLMLLMVMLACCRCCVPCLPMCFSCIFWIFGVVFALLGVFLNILAYVFSATCGEVELQYEREPGIFQWYLVPFCKNQFDFAAINKEVSDSESKFAETACAKLLEVCDNTETTEIPDFGRASLNVPGFPSILNNTKSSNLPKSQGSGVSNGKGLTDLLGDKLKGGIPNPNDPKSLEGLQLPEGLPPLPDVDIPGNISLSTLTRPLKCGKGITSTKQCPNFGIMADVLVDSSIKAYTTACPELGKSCSLIECAANCTIEDVKSASRNILQAALLARNASIALSYARPLLECNFVIDKVIDPLASCNEFKMGSYLLGVGFFVGGLMFGLAIYIMLRGSCIWRTQVTKDG